jgi:hypothetical protein
MMTNDELQQAIATYEQLKPQVQDISYRYKFVVFKKNNLDGWMINRETLVLEDSWGLIDDDLIEQSRSWLAFERLLRAQGIFRTGGRDE